LAIGKFHTDLDGITVYATVFTVTDQLPGDCVDFIPGHRIIWVSFLVNMMLGD